MKKTCLIVLILITLFSFTSCENENQSKCSSCGKPISTTANFCEHCGVTTTKKIDNKESSNNDYKKFVELIELEKFEEAYKSLDAFEDKTKANELRNKFTIIKNVLINQNLCEVEDKFGNKYGPFTVEYKYTTNGNLIEIHAGDFAGRIGGTFNPFMKYVEKVNYSPYFEKLSYDNNRMIKVEGYSQNLDKIIYTADFYYDEKGNIIKVVYAYNNGTTEATYVYNKNNQLMQVNQTHSIKKIEYDNNGNPIEKGTIYDVNGRVTESKYYYIASGDSLEGKRIWNYGDFYIYNK